MYGRAPEDDLLARQREAKAVEMRLQGYQFDEIAIECGYVSEDGKPYTGSAVKAWKRALKRIPQQAVDEARETMRLRLDSYRKAVAKLKYGDNTARIIEVLTKVEEREAKLLGLDAIEDAALSNPPQIIISEDVMKAIQGLTPTYIEGSVDGSASASQD
jgi:hypothetical protein